MHVYTRFILVSCVYQAVVYFWFLFLKFQMVTKCFNGRYGRLFIIPCGLPSTRRKKCLYTRRLPGNRHEVQRRMTRERWRRALTAACCATQMIDATLPATTQRQKCVKLMTGIFLSQRMKEQVPGGHCTNLNRIQVSLALSLFAYTAYHLVKDARIIVQTVVVLLRNLKI